MEDLSWRLTLSELSRRLDRHRRAAVAVLVGVAVLASLSAVTPKPRPTTLVWTAARDLAGGAPLQAADIALHPLPPTDVPAGALVGQRAPLGRVLAAPVRRGEPLTDVRLVGPALLAALGQDGEVAVPVRVADGAAAAALARAGDVVDVLVSSDRDGAADAARVVASAVTVLATPRADGTGGDAGLVVVAATAAQASTLAQAAVTGRLSLALRHA